MSSNPKANQSGNTIVIVLAAVVIALLILIAVLLIRNENQKTRDTLEKVGQETREGMKDAAAEGGRAGVKEGADQVKELPSTILNDLLDIIRGGTGDKSGSSGNLPKDLVRGALDVVREGIKTIEGTGQEVFALSSEQEIALGKVYHEEMLKTCTIVTTKKDLDRIKRLAEPFLKSRTRKDIPYTFTIIEDEDVNAASLPGGYIYVHTGLLKLLAKDAELQSVIGHEIGHVDLKHCVEGLTFAVTAGEFTGGAASVPVAELYNFYDLQFSEDDEFAADEYSYIVMRKNGHSKEAAVSGLRHLIEYYKSLGIATTEEDPETIPAVLEQEFHNHFRTHPPTEERVKKLEALKIEGIDD